MQDDHGKTRSRVKLSSPVENSDSASQDGILLCSRQCSSNDADRPCVLEAGVRSAMAWQWGQQRSALSDGQPMMRRAAPLFVSTGASNVAASIRLEPPVSRPWTHRPAIRTGNHLVGTMTPFLNYILDEIESHWIVLKT